LFSPLEVPLGTSGKTKLPDGILRDYMFDCLFPEVTLLRSESPRSGVPHGQRPNFKGGKKEMR
jgi:hypothetical protein